VLEYPYGPRLLPPVGGGSIDMWRYRALLPVEDGPIRYPLAVGGTPLVAPAALRSALGAPRLWVKNETTGPSASMKDRATALVLETGLRSGASVVTTSSTGNAAIATALGAAAVGMRAVIFVSEACPRSKVAIMLELGADVVRVRAGYRAAFDVSRAAAARFGWLDRNTGANPVTIEGKKTLSFEVWEQLGRGVPDVVVVPVGDGPTLAGVAKGFRELKSCGAASRTPRVVGVQAEGSQPIARAWREHAAVRPGGADTIADGIAVPEPALGDWAVDEVRLSGGAFVTVPDEELEAAVTLLGEHAGIRSEPAGAASLAGYRAALRAGLVRADECALVMVTGRDQQLRAPEGVTKGTECTIGGHPDELPGALAGRFPGLVSVGGAGSAVSRPGLPSPIPNEVQRSVQPG